MILAVWDIIRDMQMNIFVLYCLSFKCSQVKIFINVIFSYYSFLKTAFLILHLLNIIHNSDKIYQYMMDKIGKLYDSYNFSTIWFVQNLFRKFIKLTNAFINRYSIESFYSKLNPIFANIIVQPIILTSFLKCSDPG